MTNLLETFISGLSSSAQDKPMRQLILVRHAQTQANVQGLWQGQNFDSQVTPLGRLQIEAAARRLGAEKENVVAVYTSPLGRAMQTAQGIGAALGLDPVAEPGLIEMDFGELDNWTLAEIAAKRPDFFAAWLDQDNQELTWPGGESRRDFAARVLDAYERMLARHPEKTIVVVAHGGTQALAVALMLGWPLNIASTYRLNNCSLSRLVYRYEHWILQSLNDTCHLDCLTRGNNDREETNPG